MRYLSSRIANWAGLLNCLIKINNITVTASLVRYFWSLTKPVDLVFYLDKLLVLLYSFDLETVVLGFENSS